MSKHRGPGAPIFSVKKPPSGDKASGNAVTFRVARLEPRMVLAIAGFTLWAGVVLNPGDTTIWLLAIYAAAVGGWCRISPARRQSVMFARATLLLLGALMLQASVDVADPQGPYFIWPIMVTAVYSLLLSGRWVVALWALVVVEFVCIHVFANSTASWHLSFTQAGALVFFAFAATEFGNSVRELDQRAEQSRRDPNSRLYNEDGFFAHGGQLFDECRRRNRPFSMVLLNSADLREVADLSGKKAANQVFAQLVARIEAATPPGGIAARTDAVEFGVVLPGVTAVRAAQLLHQHLGQPPKVAVQLKGSRLTVMLDSVVAESTSDVGSLEDMYDRLRAKLLKRAGEVPSVPAEAHSTLQGMLESDSMLPHYARPTMPMAYADSLPPGAT
ncbi:MAG: GGDEF domain-containing protein [Ramlibacter sp.]|nr:diguanylate cyclase [Ramlibacter sp.]